MTTSEAQIDLRPLHARVSQRFAETVAKVRSDQWRAPTPCAEWDVRTLVDHVVRWNTLVPELLNGLSVQEMDRPFERDVLGSDPVDAAEQSVQQAVGAFAADGALERLVHHPLVGDAPGGYVLFLRLFDNAIHGWDLARAIGADAHVDPEALAVISPFVHEHRAAIRASGAYGPAECDVAADADEETRVLAILGRCA